MALLTAAQARVYIPGLTGTDEDTDLGTFIDRAGAMIADWLGYPPASVGGNATIESTAYTRYYEGPGGRDLVLDVWPVTAITSIEDDALLDFDGSTYLVAAADYSSGAFDGSIGLVRLTSTAAHGEWSDLDDRSPIKAVYTAGYTTVPDVVEHACGQLVRHLWDLRKRQGAMSAGATGKSKSMRPETIPKQIKEALAPLRLPRAVL